MHPVNDACPPEAKRLRAALDMHDFGVAMYRQRMRRENPAASDGKIDALVRAWLLQPGTSGREEAGDDTR